MFGFNFKNMIKNKFFREKEKQIFCIKARQIIPTNVKGEFNIFVNNNSNSITIRCPDLDKYSIIIDGDLSNIFYINSFVTKSPYNYFQCFIVSKTLNELIKDKKTKKIYDLKGIHIYNNDLKNEIIHRIAFCK
jgi:hypothetical protein